MQDYTNYTPEDFAQDDDFIQWVKSPEIERETFWQNWQETYPFKRNDVELARQLVLLTRHLPEPNVSGEEIRAMKSEVFRKIEELETPEDRVLRQLPVWRWASAAAVTGVLLLAGWYMFFYQSGNSPAYNEMVSKASEEYKLIEIENPDSSPRLVNLPDGSSVLLKKGSRLSYPNHFKKDLREIYLTGEGFFEVAKDPERPFYVFANEMVTKVLGTSFTVKAYSEDEQVFVKVKTGKVSVFQSGTAEEKANFGTNELRGLVLNPNQEATFEKGRVIASKQSGKKQDAATEPQIQDMMFEYEEVTVGEIFAQLEKAYQIRIVYDKTVMEKCPVTASLTDEPLSSKLSLICKAVRSDYEIKNGDVIISGKGCD
jgi:transmembrane sensor